jgi:hypothetical protein
MPPSNEVERELELKTALEIDGMVAQSEERSAGLSKLETISPENSKARCWRNGLLRRRNNKSIFA